MSSISSLYALSNATNSDERVPAPNKNSLGGGARRHNPFKWGGDEREIPSRRRQSPDSPSTHTVLHRKAASESRRGGPPSEMGVLEERRREKSHVAVLDMISVRTRSPEKEQNSGYPYERNSTRGLHTRDSGSVVETVRPVSRRKERETPQVQWKPQVTLIPHTTAPLACRASAPPLASQAPPSLQPQPLSQLRLEAQESAILEDLMFVFMGYEGRYIRFVESYDPLQEKDRLRGPEFRILPGLDPSFRDLTTSMLDMAAHYAAVDAFVDVQSREEFGSINHALCAAIRVHLKEYLELVTRLEQQFLTDSGFTLHLLRLQTLPTTHTFLQLYALSQEILRKNRMLENELDDSMDDLSDVENILETLREGGDIFSSGNVGGKKICKGGTVLGFLTRRLASMSGDPGARRLLTNLLREASRPYMRMLNEWLHHGGIRDPHAEFLVKEQKSIRRDELEQDYTDQYWEKRYTIRETDIPPQLEGVKEKVLLAGKYLNVVRECGGVDISKEVRDVPTTFDDPRFLDNVNGAYAHANSSLLNLLLTTHALPARLQSLKHYFFLDRSDFFSYFLELGTSELKKPAKIVNVGKLQSLLDLVLRQPGSVAAQDPFKEDVKVQMNEVDLTKWLMRVVNVSGLDNHVGSIDHHNQTSVTQSSSSAEDEKYTGFNALELDYFVPFPLSLVISRKTVLRYQLLFRYLLSLRHLETLLVGSWNEHSKVMSWKHQSSDRRLEMWKRRAWTLRARMLVFVQQLLFFCTAEVIEPNWRNLMARLEGATATSDDRRDASSSKGMNRTVDELMQDHVDFLDTCLKECMLTNPKLLRLHSKITSTITLFATYTAHLSHRALPATDPDLLSTSTSAGTTTSTTTSTQHDPTRLDKLSDNLQKYEENFARHLKILLDALNYYAATETVVLLGLCARLSAASEGYGFAGAGGGSGSGREGVVEGSVLSMG
ncbi:MAG: hypothetical protein M1816_000142 [Peltula sp. TS41687]|nr:MAG: hypothetical protein M1816_000142 [Peltula sp. TS41687]